jgi:putative acetyltransferase
MRESAGDTTVVIVRDAQPADAEAIRAVHYESILGLGPATYDEEQVAAWAAGCETASYAESITDEEVVFLVGTREAVVVAFGSLRLTAPGDYEANPDAEVTGVYVHPRVARSGVGGRVYEELETRARDANVDRLGLSASRNAVAFYEQHGFERVRTRSHEFSPHAETGVIGEVVEMVKRL